MKPLSSLSEDILRGVNVVLTDIDDTVTTEGQLTSEAYQAITALSRSGVNVIPVTGRCAGWCDHIARMWPVKAVVGENGAFYFFHDRERNTLEQRFMQDAATRQHNNQLLQTLQEKIVSYLPHAVAASDQPYRLVDLAVDISEDVTPLTDEQVQQILRLAEEAGAVARISSIHVNCWFGKHSKLSTSLLALRECLGLEQNQLQEVAMFVGDSPNDESMFAHFDLSVGVANVLSSIDLLVYPPKYITQQLAGGGFVELAQRILQAKGMTHNL